MRLRLSAPFALLCYLMTLFIGELHEQAHILTGAAICSGFGPRDFNAWSTMAQCARPEVALAAPLAGPLFSYAVMGLALWLLYRGSRAQQSIALPLLFAPVPFARIFTAAMGGGDEKVFLAHLLGDAAAPMTVRLLALALTLLFCGVPMVLAWRKLAPRGRSWIIAGFAVLPLLVTVLYQFKFLNGVLKAGTLAQPLVLGTPALVWLHTLLVGMVLWVGRRTLTNALA